jgi:hypothetical protein
LLLTRVKADRLLSLPVLCILRQNVQSNWLRWTYERLLFELISKHSSRR